MKILYAASEANPFAKSGGLADVAGSLPKALVKDGIDARVVMPLYGDLKLRSTLTYVTNFSVPVGWRSQYCGLFTAVADGVTYYFLDNEYYFKRAGLYGFYDDGERFAFFSRAVLEMLFYLDFAPDVINCNDWQTGLVPVYLNLYYRHLDKFNRVKTIFTIHNIAYQGKYGLEILEDTCGISKRDQHIVEYDGCANFMKGAIECADKVTTVSPTYAQEILDPWFAHGLDALLREKQYKLCGILNGIDTEINNPSTDPSLPAHYSVKSFKKGKPKCKEALQDRFALEKDGSPVFAVVSRLVGMKGLDLLQSIADALVNDGGIELVVLGTGESGYEAFFSDLAARHPGRVGTVIGFDSKLAQQIYAGADVFVMPSKSEPCGLAQMVSCRYGTVPVVRETGGLKDSIQDCTLGEGNGFAFADYSAHDLYDACWRAKELYWKKEDWENLVAYAMRCDFSWALSAKSYEGLYNETVNLW
ncbi:MAG: glycogen synthase [Faecalibacterium sp.]|jgi:starch synthase|nr:glycogen synthase [Faecalibacterium sp.]